MYKQTIRALNSLNRQFYQSVQTEFDSSRQHFWPGWEKIWELVKNKKKLEVLDLASGNGRFGRFLSQQVGGGGEINYTGVDNNPELLAKTKLPAKANHDQKFLTHQSIKYSLVQADIIENLLGKPPGIFESSVFEPSISEPARSKPQSKPATFDLITIFGFIHHVPSEKLRSRLLQESANLLSPGGILVVSVWQMITYQKLMDRQTLTATLPACPYLNHKIVSDLEENDFLLDWQRGQTALRYCHQVTPAEMSRLAANLPLKLVANFGADGLNKQSSTKRGNEYFVFERSG